jgi:hypothetical protein
MKKRLKKQEFIFIITLICISSSMSIAENSKPSIIRDEQANNYVTNNQNFTIIVLPDTQYYSQTYPAIYTNQTQWIVNHKDALNILYVAHEGDIVNNAYQRYQYVNACTSMSYLEDPKTTQLPDGIPYSILPGNHDRPTFNYNHYFGVRRFKGRDYYGGHYSFNNNNNYVLFSAAGMDFIAISLQYNPNMNKINWANHLLQIYANRRAILVSHDILNLAGGWDKPGQTIYNTIKNNRNLFLMLCGHNLGEARRTDTYNSNVVYTLLADYQSYSNGGDGFLRIMEFCPATNEIRVKTYSPYLNQFKTDNSSQFTLEYRMRTPINTSTVNVEGSGTVVKTQTTVYMGMEKMSYSQRFSLTVGLSLIGVVILQEKQTRFLFLQR